MNSKFLNTVWGSYLKVFVSGILVVYSADLAQGVDIFIMNTAQIKKIVTAGLVPLLPIILNAINKQDRRYGKKPLTPPFPVESKDIKS